MIIRILDEHDFADIRNFYWQLIDNMQQSCFMPGWKKEIYPSDDFLAVSLKEKNLYALYEGVRIAAAMVMNHECNDGYHGTEWAVEAAPNEVTVIHALGVCSEYQGHGLAKRMVIEAIRISRTNQQKAIRLDVLNGNQPAIQLYQGLGFQYRRTVKMFYEDTGWTDYHLYEFLL